MKKFITVTFLLIFAILLTSCGAKDKSSNDNYIDIDYYANLGQIPECQVDLGDSASDTENILKKATPENEEAFFEIDEGKDNVLLNNGVYNCYYKTKKKDNGISCIVTFDKAFGFEIGTLSIEIKEALSSFELVEESVNDKNAFFVWGVSNGSILKYKTDKNTLTFVFSDNALCATAIYKTSDWE